MNLKIIQERLETYRCQSEQEETLALKEIIQEIILAALSRTDFFKYASFQGGTCLRILYSLDRFSEDLDFTLQKPDLKFDWSVYLKDLELECRAFGFEFSTQDRSELDNPIRKAFLKEDSIGKILVLKHRPADRKMKAIKIKFELDVNPPAGAQFEIKYLDFPFAAAVLTQDLPSLFAGKSHALLCREYVKGRDWYDFLWYVARKTIPNYEYLSRACEQQGSWKGQKLQVNAEWYLEKMREKILSLDWKAAKDDIARFLRPVALPTLDLWSKDFFLDRLQKMEDYSISTFRGDGSPK